MKKRPASAAPEGPVPGSAPPDRRLVSAVCVLLLIAVAVIYGQVLGHGFIDLDDDLYVTANPHVTAGLTAPSVAWALTTFHAANWHPLTWLSHMADISAFGLRPGPAHLTNVLLHALNALFAFFVFRSMTGAAGRSAAVAALFAVHPMHVESVAWIAERKDVLSTAFWLLAMLAYARETRRGRMPWAGGTTAFMALGLLAKPMLVTLPFVLLILDYWPLGRWRAEPGARPAGFVPRARPLVVEKWPLFALSAASAIATFVAQRAGGAVQDVVNVPLSYRLSNALLSCGRYLAALVWPHGMAVYYPYPPEGPPIAGVAAAAVVIVAISALVWLYRARLPYLATGWLWYLVTLIPVIGLVQVGGQAMADRYTYIPYFGLFLMGVWAAADALQARRTPAAVVAVLTAVPLIALGAVAYRQTSYWRDSVTLFEHALAVTRDNAAIEYNLGVTLGRQGRTGEAEAHFAQAVRIWPEFSQAQLNLGVAQAAMGRLDEATAAYARALALRPDSAETEMNLGGVLAQMGRLEDAAPHLERAAALAPTDARPLANLGLVELRRGRTQEALDHLQRAVTLDPRSAVAQNNLGLALLVAGRPGEAAPHFARALALDPSFANARENLSRAEQALGAGGAAR